MYSEYRYSLDRRAGKKKSICPQCHRRSLTLYVDNETGEPLSEYYKVGRCDHESHCCYHYTPREYFRDHPEAQQPNWRSDMPYWLKKRTQGCRADFSCYDENDLTPAYDSDSADFDTIPTDIIEKQMRHALDDLDSCDLLAYLASVFGASVVKRVVRDYKVGRMKTGEVIFPQIDIFERVRTAKVMKYDRLTGHRVKDTGHDANWLHCNRTLIRQGRISNSKDNPYRLNQCLFGEHLLRLRPNDIVIIVESEKTALVGSCSIPECVWLATGGINNLKPEKAESMRGRKVLVYPDVDAMDKWQEKVSIIAMSGIDIRISHLLQDTATESEREAKIDIADRLLDYYERRGGGVRQELLERPKTMMAASVGRAETHLDSQNGKVSDMDCETLRTIKRYVSEENQAEVIALVRDFGLSACSLEAVAEPDG